VRPRALAFFRRLAQDGRLDSVQVADEILDCNRPAIGARLTRWIRKRASELSCELPYDGGLGEEAYGGIVQPRPSDDAGRTYYEDRDGIAGRMVEALQRLA
jgi:hypothetical protein